jgi:acyl carrier protein
MNGKREQWRRDLVHFLRGIQKAGVPIETLSDTDGLVSSGLIDSLAVLEIVMYLEQNHGMDFSARGIDPEELGSIARILDLIEGER